MKRNRHSNAKPLPFIFLNLPAKRLPFICTVSLRQPFDRRFVQLKFMRARKAKGENSVVTRLYDVKCNY